MDANEYEGSRGRPPQTVFPPPAPPSPRHTPVRTSVINIAGKPSNQNRPSNMTPSANFLMSPPPVPPMHQSNSHYNIQNPSVPSGESTSALIEALSNKSTPNMPLTPQPSRISGEVALTPTYSVYTPNVSNPHSSMIPQTPMSSGPNQAKNSIKLQNCVSTVNLQCELKLLDIYCRTRFSEYNPSRFHGVVMKILEPRTTALVFRTGKLVCTGAKNEHDSLLATKKFARIIQKLGFPVRFSDFKIQNLVATADLRFPIRLEALQQAHGQFTSYEPELFPGLVYRMIRPRIVLLIFVNGKIVFTGGKSRDDVTESLNIIYPILRSFRKN